MTTPETTLEERKYIHPFFRQVEPRHRQPGFKPDPKLLDPIKRKRRFTIQQLVDAAGQVDQGYKWNRKRKEWVKTDQPGNWKDWYASNDEILSSIFGKDMDLFKTLLAVTSPRVSVKKNVNNALKVYKSLLKNEPLPEDLFTPHRLLLDKIFSGEGITAPKVGPFERNLFGDRESVTIDTHMLQLLEGQYNPKLKEYLPPENPQNSHYYFADALVRKIANKLGWTPDQTQAALWVFNIELRGETPQSYSKILQQRKNQPWIYQYRGEQIQEPPLMETIPKLQEESGGPFLGSEYEGIEWPKKAHSLTQGSDEEDIESVLDDVLDVRSQAILDAERFWNILSKSVEWYNNQQ